MRQHPLARLLPAATLVLFAVFAANFLYFFVDDEGIPLVYAQNLVQGRGLVYTPAEGRVEGYSDFLHVLQSAVVLSAVRALGLPKISVFFIGKALSFASGLALLAVVLATLRRLRVGTSSRAGAMALLVLTGPLALWSCSSLEAVPTALGVSLLAWALVAARDRVALAASAFLVLERIDGFVPAGALIAAFLLTVAPERRRALARGVVAPLAAVFAVYHAGRFLYFGDWLPTPLEAKVLYKMMPHAQLVEKKASAPYLVRFAAAIGWPMAAALLASGALAVLRGGPLRAVALACGVLVLYVSTVGDWMFGFRFFVPVLPLAAIVLAGALSAAAGRYPRASAAGAVAIVVWCAAAGAAFTRTYAATMGVEPFLAHPSTEPGAFFRPYYSLYSLARKHVTPGTVVADNQAGFVPFMLDLENIDDLGICSRFYAELPSTDVYFTEVGKYQPLTPARPEHAGEAYLLYRDARFLLLRSELLRAANGRVPAELLGGFYELLAVDDVGDNTIYRRTTLDAERFRTSPDAFMENVAHVSYVRSAIVGGTAIEPAQAVEGLPWLRGQAGYVTFTGRTSAAVTFGQADDLVFHVGVGGISVSAPARLDVALRSADGRTVARESLSLDAGQPGQVWIDLPAGARAHRLDLHIVTASSGTVTARLTDVRVLGQKPALRDYIRRELAFPPR